MRPTKKLFLVVSLLAVSLMIIVWYGWSVRHARTIASASCRMVFLDVGQGDAILIQTPDHQDLLIDGGPRDTVSRQLGPYLGFGNNEIETAILTHPDSDHLTGLLAVVNDWPVRTVLTTGVVTTTKLYQRWVTTVEKSSAKIVPVQSSQVYKLGNYLTIDILWPDQSWNGKPYTAKASNGRGGINDTSVGTKITCAGSTALMIGDASDAVEVALLAEGKNIHADLLKIGHHGSKFSSDHEFLQAVAPDVAVIPVGRDNRYNHPHPAVLERLTSLHIPVYRTDQQGTLEFRSVPGGWRLTP